MIILNKKSFIFPLRVYPENSFGIPEFARKKGIFCLLAVVPRATRKHCEYSKYVFYIVEVYTKTLQKTRVKNIFSSSRKLIFKKYFFRKNQKQKKTEKIFWDFFPIEKSFKIDFSKIDFKWLFNWTKYQNLFLQKKSHFFSKHFFSRFFFISKKNMFWKKITYINPKLSQDSKNRT